MHNLKVARELVEALRLARSTDNASDHLPAGASGLDLFARCIDTIGRGRSIAALDALTLRYVEIEETAPRRRPAKAC